MRHSAGRELTRTCATSSGRPKCGPLLPARSLPPAGPEAEPHCIAEGWQGCPALVGSSELAAGSQTARPHRPATWLEVLAVMERTETAESRRLAGMQHGRPPAGGPATHTLFCYIGRHQEREEQQQVCFIAHRHAPQQGMGSWVQLCILRSCQCPASSHDFP